MRGPRASRSRVPGPRGSQGLERTGDGFFLAWQRKTTARVGGGKAIPLWAFGSLQVSLGLYIVGAILAWGMLTPCFFSQMCDVPQKVKERLPFVPSKGARFRRPCCGRGFPPPLLRNDVSLHGFCSGRGGRDGRSEGRHWQSGSLKGDTSKIDISPQSFLFGFSQGSLQLHTPRARASCLGFVRFDAPARCRSQRRGLRGGCGAAPGYLRHLGGVPSAGGGLPRPDGAGRDPSPLVQTCFFTC